jgi:predicted metalloprotease with PDZ domain
VRIALFVAVLALPLFAQAEIHYEVSFPNAAHHEAEVRATFDGVHTPELEVVMSRSSPGRYALHEFAKNVYNFRASDAEGKPLEVRRPSPYQWNIAGHKGTVVVEYTLFGDRADGTYDGIDPTHAHLNIPATFAWAHGFEHQPIAVKFDLPPGADWKIATQLVPRDDGTWSASDLDWFMDSPVELGPVTMREWKVGDARFRLALHHAGTDEEAAACARMCEAVVTEAEGVFGAFPKYDNGMYTFLVDYLPYVNGDGMEHRDSTVITGTSDLKSSAQWSIGTVSHEFFHSWNVERIRPKSLEPFDFERANMSGELWFAEGFTSYYGSLILKRAGLASLDDFVREISQAVSTVTTDPGRNVFNVIDMSRQAPFVDAATANEPVNTSNTFISYYTYGDALGLGIDLAIRSRFPGKSLDDWMKTMWRHHPDVRQPYTLGDLEATLAETTGNKKFAAGIFRRHVYGKEPLEYGTLLARAGMLLQKSRAGKAWLGVNRLSFSSSGVEIAGSTFHDSPLFAAGLDRGDRVTEWDGKTLKSREELDDWLASRKPGAKVHLRVEGRAGKRQVDLTLTEFPGVQIVPYEQAGRELTTEMAAFRQDWLGSKAIHALPALSRYCPECRRAYRFEESFCPYDGKALTITQASSQPSE